MKNIIIDSCVFFKMIKYNDCFEKFGIDGVKQLIQRDKEIADKLRKETYKTLPDEFLKSKADPNATEEKLIESCKEFATNKMSNLLSYIKKSIKAIVGYQEDTLAHSDFNTTIDKLVENLKHFYSESETALETPFPNNKNFTKMIKDLEDSYLNHIHKIGYHPKEESKIPSYYDDISRSINEYLGIAEQYKGFLEKREVYKTAVDFCDVGELYLRVLNGEFALNVAQVSYDELLNHTDGISNIQKEKSLKFDAEQIQSLTEKCTILSIKNNSSLEAIEKISSDLRTPSEGNGASPMAQDLNSLNDYGDSKIEAMSLASGFILVTLNCADFIGDKSQRILKHVKKTGEKLGLSDALPYSVSDLLEGNVKWPTKQGMFELREVANKQIDFNNELELTVNM